MWCHVHLLLWIHLLILWKWLGLLTIDGAPVYLSWTSDARALWEYKKNIRCSSYSAKHLLILFGFFLGVRATARNTYWYCSGFFLGVRATARNTYWYCSVFFFFFFFSFFLGVRATARNTYWYCSVFFFFFFFFSSLLLPLRPIDCRQKNTYLQTAHELETWHVLRT